MDRTLLIVRILIQNGVRVPILHMVGVSLENTRSAPLAWPGQETVVP
jgi:hypothetical protein